MSRLLGVLNDTRITRAAESLGEFLDADNLTWKSFLDVGEVALDYLAFLQEDWGQRYIRLILIHNL